jgi:hypothetical protein
MKKGEFSRFCKDFKIFIPQSKQIVIFNKCSENHQPLEVEQFKKALPLLGMEMAIYKSTEIKFRLKEIKNVLEYPENKFNISAVIEDLINDVETVPARLGKIKQRNAS